jgi:hypothetical protein
MSIDRGLVAEQAWWIGVAVLCTLFLATLVLSAIDERSLAGVGVWMKPMKFSISLAIHFATLALVARLLSEPVRSHALLLALAAVSIMAALGEMAYIVARAARQEASHFNVATPLAARLYGLMAIGAVIIVASAGVLGLVALVDRGAAMGGPLRTAIALGLAGGTALTLLVAFTMGGRMAHLVGVEAAGAPRMPLTGWSRTAGDLRVPHFFATHMIQAIPLAGLVLERAWTGSVGVLAAWLLALAWTALTLATFRQALSGAPFAW